jgi:hypothetical protein
MATMNITEQQILEALQRLPLDRWTEVLSFIDSLQGREKAAGSPIRTAEDLARSELVGIWANRTDMGSSQSFARQLRQRAESRRGDTDASGY